MVAPHPGLLVFFCTAVVKTVSPSNITSALVEAPFSPPFKFLASITWILAIPVFKSGGGVIAPSACLTGSMVGIKWSPKDNSPTGLLFLKNAAVRFGCFGLSINGSKSNWMAPTCLSFLKSLKSMQVMLNGSDKEEIGILKVCFQTGSLVSSITLVLAKTLFWKPNVR